VITFVRGKLVENGGKEKALTVVLFGPQKASLTTDMNTGRHHRVIIFMSKVSVEVHHRPSDLSKTRQFQIPRPNLSLSHKNSVMSEMRRTSTFLMSFVRSIKM